MTSRKLYKEEFVAIHRQAFQRDFMLELGIAQRVCVLCKKGEEYNILTVEKAKDLHCFYDIGFGGKKIYTSRIAKVYAFLDELEKDGYEFIPITGEWCFVYDVETLRKLTNDLPSLLETYSEGTERENVRKDLLL